MTVFFRANPNYATELLDEVRRSGDSAELAIFVRQVTTANLNNEDDGRRECSSML
nr:addiction module antidote protein [Escherichia coli]